MLRLGLIRRAIRSVLPGLILAGAGAAHGQIQVDLKLPRLQFIAHEPVIATLGITNRAGRDVDLRDSDGQAWFGFEVTGKEGQPIGPMKTGGQGPLKIEAGKHVTQKIDLGALYPVQDFGVYHVRAHIYFSDLGKYFYSPAKVFEVTDARPIWQQTVGIPDGVDGAGGVRTYSLMTNRFPNHTSLYVRVADKDRNVVYATYSLGRMIAFDDPQVQIDQGNHLHVLHCSAPRSWSYSQVGLNGELLSHSSFMETKSRPRLVHAADGMITVRGGMQEVAAPAGAAAASAAPKLSERPANGPKEE